MNEVKEIEENGMRGLWRVNFFS